MDSSGRVSGFDIQIERPTALNFTIMGGERIFAELGMGASEAERRRGDREEVRRRRPPRGVKAETARGRSLPVEAR